MYTSRDQHMCNLNFEKKANRGKFKGFALSPKPVFIMKRHDRKRFGEALCILYHQEVCLIT